MMPCRFVTVHGSTELPWEVHYRLTSYDGHIIQECEARFLERCHAWAHAKHRNDERVERERKWAREGGTLADRLRQ